MGTHFTKMIFSTHSVPLFKIIGMAFIVSLLSCRSEAQVDAIEVYDPVKDICSSENFLTNTKVVCSGKCPCTVQEKQSRMLQEKPFRMHKEKPFRMHQEKLSRSLQEKQSQFAKEMLDAHNKFRSQHGVPPLQLDPKLNAYAQKLAESNRAAGKLAHTPPEKAKYGENLAWGAGMQANGRDIVKRWYDEKSMYKGKFSSGTGHFSQLIWKSSQKLGVGLAVKGNEYFVANVYDPRGNVMGAFEENVPM